MSSRSSSSRNSSLVPRRASSNSKPTRNLSFSLNSDWTFDLPLEAGNDPDWSNVNFDSEAFSGYNGLDQQQSDDFFLDSLAYMPPEQETNVEKSRRASVQMMNRPLAAVPGLDNALSIDLPNDFNLDPSLLNSAYGQASVYGDQSEATAPYYTENYRYQQDYDNFVPVSQNYRSNTAANAYDDDLQYSTSPKTRKRARDDDSIQEGPRKRSQESETRRSSGDSSSLSETSSLRKTRRSRTMITRAVYEPEKPQTDQNKHWIRINQITEGKTSRTGKINHYKAEEVYNHSLPNTIGDWQGSKTLFQYDRYGELHNRTYSTKEIREFLYEHPRTKDCKLKLWIQRSPADSARRYPQEHSSKCRFRSCPIQAHFKGTILHGHYRVAFDEKWHKYRENADPFHVAGYVHLYCLERFLDFPDICRKLDVEADDRRLRNEPKGRFLASLGNSCEGGIASRFIEDCRYGKLDEGFPDYPIHAFYRHGEPKPHKHTLTYALTKGKTETRPPAQIRQFEERGLSSSHILVHMGDLEKFVSARLEKKSATKRRKRGEPEEEEASESEVEVVKAPRRARGTAAPRHEAPSPQRPSRAQAAVEPRRKSPRNRSRVSYANMDLEDSTDSGDGDGLFVPEDNEQETKRTQIDHPPGNVAISQPYGCGQHYNPNFETDWATQGAYSLQQLPQPSKQVDSQAHPRRSSLFQGPRRDRQRSVSWAPHLEYGQGPEYQPEQQLSWPDQQFMAQQPLGFDYNGQASGRRPSNGLSQLLDSIASYEPDPNIMMSTFDDTQLFDDLTAGEGFYTRPSAFPSPAVRTSPRSRRSSTQQERKSTISERSNSKISSPPSRRQSARLRSRNSSFGSLFGGSPSPPAPGN